MKKVVEIRKTCGACPEQYEGLLDNGETFYIRCRWGQARIDIPHGTTAATMQYDDEWRGEFESPDDIKKLMKDAGVDGDHIDFSSLRDEASDKMKEAMDYLKKLSETEDITEDAFIKVFDTAGLMKTVEGSDMVVMTSDKEIQTPQDIEKGKIEADKRRNKDEQQRKE